MATEQKSGFMGSSVLSGRSGHDFWVGFSVIVIVIGIFIGQGLVVAMGVMGLVAGVVATMWSKVALEDLVYHRRIEPARAFIGDEVKLAIELSNKKPIPLPWVRASDQIPEALTISEGDFNFNAITHLQRLSQSTSIGWYERVRWNYKLTCTRRGRFRIGARPRREWRPLRLSHQPRGWVDERDELLVYPKVFSLNDLGIPSVRPLGEVRGGMRIFADPSLPSGLRGLSEGRPPQEYRLEVNGAQAPASGQDLLTPAPRPPS